MIIAAVVATTLLLTTPTIKVLENGATAIVQPIPNSKTYSVQLFVRAGSAYQTSDDEGVFHLIEHLVFRSSDAQYLAEMSGSWMNATTYREFTRYVVTGPAESWKEGLKSLVKLAGTLRAISFESLATESSVIVEEIVLQDLDNDAAMDRALWRTAFANTSWGMRTSGVPASIVRIGRSEIEPVVAKHYVGANMVLVAAGDVRTEEVLAECEEISRFERGSRASLPTVPEPLRGRTVVKTPDGFARVGLGFSAPGISDPTYPAFRVALEALAGRYGLLADAGLRTSLFFGPSEKGSLATLILSGKERAEEVEKAALEVLRASTTSISELHFSSAKAIVLSEIRAASKSPDRAALTIGVGAILGKTDYFATELEVIEKITIEDVKAVLESLKLENATVIVGSR